MNRFGGLATGAGNEPEDEESQIAGKRSGLGRSRFRLLRRSPLSARSKKARRDEVAEPRISRLRQAGGLIVDESAALAAGVLHRRTPRLASTLHRLDNFVGRPLQQLFPSDHSLPGVEATARWSHQGLRCDALRFASSYVPLDPGFRDRYASDGDENDFVHIRSFRHLDHSARGTMIYLHAWMQPYTLWEERVMLPNVARRLKVDVLRMDLPYHRRRKPRRSLYSGEYFWSADMVRSVEALRHAVHDVRSLITWLENEGRGPVGIAGISLGGLVTMWTLCVDDRLAWAIPMMAHTDTSAVLRRGSIVATLRQRLADEGWRAEDAELYAESIGISKLEPRIDPERIQMVAGLYDRFFRRQDTITQWKRWGQPHLHWLPTGHLGAFPYLAGPMPELGLFLGSTQARDAVGSVRPK